MVNICVEIETTRDISRQIIRHRSFSFQEFSQRYALANNFTTRECRVQHPTNRQMSLMTDNDELSQKFTATASLGEVSEFSYDGYQAFTATITSEVAGNGDIKLSFDNKTFSTVNIPTDLAQPSSVNEQILTYQFINTTTGVDVPRRDEGDTSIGSSGGGS
jgi:hypothetical protein